MTKFKIGEEVTVTGDTVDVGHPYPEGTRATISEIVEYDDELPCYVIICEDEDDDYAYGEHEVAEEDLETVYEAPTPEELADTFRSLGLPDGRLF